MKLVFRTVFLHIFFIIIFSFIYLHFKEEFKPATNSDTDYKSYINFLNLSVTIQSGIGLTDLVPMTTISKFIVMFQQLILIFIHILTLYIFTL
jgi:hypothetical protein